MLTLLPLKKIQVLFIVLLALKILAYIWLSNMQNEFLSLGGDANYYDEFAHGLIADDQASSIWPLILRKLNDFGLYNRHAISWILFAVESLVVPIIIASSLPRPQFSALQNCYRKLYWHIATLVALYPTLFVYSVDIYRDVMMVLIFTLWVFVGLKVSAEMTLNNVSKIIVLAAMTYILYLFRPYLGMSLVVALCFYHINFSRINLLYLFVGYLIVLAVMQSLGVFDALLNYRSNDVFEGGGTTLGINLVDRSPVMFILLLVWSGLLQLFGLYIVSFKALMLFLIESMFFSGCCLYIFKNKQYLTKFMKSILVFTVIYGTIWIMGNDNLGTAVRVRIFNYLPVFFVAASIYFLKYAAEDKLETEGASLLSKESL